MVLSELGGPVAAWVVPWSTPASSRVELDPMKRDDALPSMPSSLSPLLACCLLVLAAGQGRAPRQLSASLQFSSARPSAPGTSATPTLEIVLHPTTADLDKLQLRLVATIGGEPVFTGEMPVSLTALAARHSRQDKWNCASSALGLGQDRIPFLCEWSPPGSDFEGALGCRVWRLEVPG